MYALPGFRQEIWPLDFRYKAVRAEGSRTMSNEEREQRLSRLQEIHMREKAATPGPWTPALCSFDCACDTICEDFATKRYACKEVHCEVAGHVPETMTVKCEYGHVGMTDADTEFIARAREDIPWLLERVHGINYCRDTLNMLVSLITRGYSIKFSYSLHESLSYSVGIERQAREGEFIEMSFSDNTLGGALSKAYRSTGAR